MAENTKKEALKDNKLTEKDLEKASGGRYEFGERIDDGEVDDGGVDDGIGETLAN